MGKVTFKKSEIKSLIQEEVEKFKKAKELQEQKKAILKQLNECGCSEMETDEDLDEGLWGDSKEVKLEKGLKAIEAHPAKKKAYAMYVAENPVKAEKYAVFVGGHPGINLISWSDKKQDFIEGGGGDSSHWSNK